jgi:hypothetical protein
MRSILGFVVVSLLVGGCAAASSGEDSLTTSSAMSRPPPGSGTIVKPPPPPPLVFNSIGGYAGTPGVSGHDDGPLQSKFVKPTHISSTSNGTTWVIDEDPNLPNWYDSAMIRVISDTRGGVPGPHVQTVGTLSDAGVYENLGGFVAAENGTDAYFTSTYECRIYKFTIGQGSTCFTGCGSGGIGGFNGYVDGNSGTALFDVPSGLAHDSAGNIFVADKNNHAIRIVDSTGTATTFARDTSWNSSFAPTMLAVTPAGNLVYAISGQALYRVTLGQITLVAGSPSTTGYVDGSAASALFQDPKGVAIDSIGDVYVADSGNQAVRKLFVRTADVETIPVLTPYSRTAGSDDAYGPDDAHIEMPFGLAFWGNQLVFSDSSRLTVRRMSPAMPWSPPPKIL